jgi:DNA-binding NarL/FixJ family response regulator
VAGFPGTRVVRVALLAQQRRLCRAFERAVTDTPGLILAGCFSSPAEALRRLNRKQVDVLVIESNGGKTSCFEILQRARQARPDGRCILLLKPTEHNSARDLLAAGATGCLEAGITMEKLIEAAQEVAAGGAVLSPSITRELIASLQSCPETLEKLSKLTARERDVFTALTEALHYKEIAQRLGLTINTVRTHIKQVYRKLGIRSRGEAITLGAQVHSHDHVSRRGCTTC